MLLMTALDYFSFLAVDFFSLLYLCTRTCNFVNKYTVSYCAHVRIRNMRVGVWIIGITSVVCVAYYRDTEATDGVVRGCSLSECWTKNSVILPSLARRATRCLNTLRIHSWVSSLLLFGLISVVTLLHCFFAIYSTGSNYMCNEL